MPWFDIDDEEWRVATLAERTITILPGAGAPAPAPIESADAETDAETPAEPSATSAAQSNFWRRIAEILGAVWVLTLVAWWWSSRPRREERPPPPVPVHKLQARQLKAARKAAVDGDAAGVRTALLEWAKLEWPAAPPRSIGAIAARVVDPAAGELLKLSQASYGPNGSEWDGEALARAVRTIRATTESRTSAEGDPLPPLMPQ